MDINDTLSKCRVIPVITPYDIDLTVRTAQALESAGVTCVEITLRTDIALESIAAVKHKLPQMILAAGTIVDSATVQSAVEVGVDLCFSPGISPPVLEACEERSLPIVPGVATASDILLGMSFGMSVFKLFPAQVSGGIELLDAYSGPFPGVSFCPTGGLTPTNVKDYLRLPNVICCGGSWMVTENLVRENRWDDIRWLAREALSD